jgi:hypothetical protein
VLGAINADPIGIHWFASILGAPNHWRNDGGKLTRAL